MSEPAEEVAKLLCVLCGLLCPAAGHGRVHGQKFICHTCAAADRQLRKGLGSKCELQTLMSLKKCCRDEQMNETFFGTKYHVKNLANLSYVEIKLNLT